MKRLGLLDDVLLAMLGLYASLGVAGCAGLDQVAEGPGTAKAELVIQAALEVVLAKTTEVMEALNLSPDVNAQRYEITGWRLLGGGLGDRVRIRIERIDAVNAKLVVMSRPNLENDARARELTQRITDQVDAAVQKYNDGLVLAHWKTDLERSRVLYDQARYTEARTSLLGLENNLRRLTTSTERETGLGEVLLLLGVVEVALGRDSEAVTRFREAKRRVPSLQIDPNQFPPRIVELFRGA